MTREITEVDPLTYGVDHFRGIKRVLEIGVGNGSFTAVTPAMGIDHYLVSDVTPGSAIYSANFKTTRYVLWERAGLDHVITPVYASGMQLPFRDGAFDAVFAMNVISDPSIPGYDKRAMLREGLRMLDPASRKLAASAFWLIHSNTPDIARPLLREWLTLPDSEGCTVERAVVPVVENCISDKKFGMQNYPLTVTALRGCEIYKITKAI